MFASSNAEIATRLDEVANLLTEQEANAFRIKSYRRAANLLRQMERPVSELVEREGLEGLMQLPGIGQSLARSIHQLVRTGKLPMLERLRGASDPVALLQTAPGIGHVLAERLHDDLGIASLEELEAAAHDGRLADLAGLGEKRIAGLRDALAARLGRVRMRGLPEAPDAPTVSEILEVDREYRANAAADTLKKIAPRRFNPTGAAWLPVLHTTRGKRHYTAFYSNTARAHQLGQTHDWVVIYYDGGDGERQCTVISARFGELTGRRIVRGREAECAVYYAQHPQANAA